MSVHPEKITALLFVAVILGGCAQDTDTLRSKEMEISRFLEQAYEVGERALEEQGIVEHVALTEGADAALALREELHHHEHYREFWDLLASADSVWRELPDSLAREAVLERLKAYIDPLVTITDGIQP